MKQEELAAKVGVRRETISNLEKGKYNPSLVLAWNIAKVFDVPIEKIFTVENWGDIYACEQLDTMQWVSIRIAILCIKAEFIVQVLSDLMDVN